VSKGLFYQIHCRLVYFYDSQTVIVICILIINSHCWYFCRFWFFKILIIVAIIIGAFFIKDPAFDEGKSVTVNFHINWMLYGVKSAQCLEFILFGKVYHILIHPVVLYGVKTLTL